MYNIGVLVSGSGSNLQAIIDSIQNNEITNGTIKTIVSNKKDVYALERAKKHNIPHTVILRKNYNTTEKFDESILNHMKENKIDFIVMAGFLAIVGQKLINSYKNKIINIHPSLIPSFCGKNYYGLKVHEEVLKRGVKITGATVHFVTEEVDGGPIILQKAIKVKQNDTKESLQERVKVEAEWKLLPKAIKLLTDDMITINDNKTIIKLK